MAGICCGVVVEGETLSPIDPTSRPSRRRRLDPLPLKYIADMAVPPPEGSQKIQKRDFCNAPTERRDRRSAVENSESSVEKPVKEDQKIEFQRSEVSLPVNSTISMSNSRTTGVENEIVEDCPKFGVTSVCGRRRDMEDAVSVYPSFCQEQRDQSQIGYHFFGVFDGHGCSHVATMCKDKLHEIVKEEIGGARDNLDWQPVMEQSFALMDEEVLTWSQSSQSSSCRCELQIPHSDAVGSTAVVAVVTPDKVIVSNCGDSRAVLCRNGVAVPLSCDHKPDRPDELLRVQAAGGRVIYWDGPRVLGVLAMSRAIGDNYLKPYVISEPEVTVTERTDEDECLILASDGLWDVVSNDTACGVVRMCLKALKPQSPPGSDSALGSAADGSDKACSDASILLTKLALARHSTDNVSVVVVDLRRERKSNSNNINNSN